MTEVSKNLMCIQMRSGVEIWAEKERVANLQGILKDLKSHIFVNYNGESLNTADMVGIFNAQTMSDHTYRKNGQWKCNQGSWHDRFSKCECLFIEEEEIRNKIREENRENHLRLYGVEPLP